MTDQYLTRQQVATMLQLHPDTITRLVDTGDLPAIILHGPVRRRLRFDPADVHEHIARFKDRSRPARYKLTPRALSLPARSYTTGKDADPWQSSNARRKPAPYDGPSST